MHIEGPEVMIMFSKLKLITAVLCVVAVAFVVVPSVKADDWDKKTIVTFDRPIEVPGTVLPPGRYMFQVMDFLGSRNVIRITDEYGVKVYATVFGIWDFTFDAPEKTKLTFYEAPKGTPEALHEWFYPGHRYGFEFAYPKRANIEVAEEWTEDLIAEVEPEPFEPHPVLREPLIEPIEPIEATCEGLEIAEVTPPEVAAPVAAVVPVPEPEVAAPVAELPKTASLVPLLGLIGIASGLAAATIRRFKG